MYELTYIASPDLTEEELQKLNQETEKIILDKKGKLKSQTSGEKKRLAYPIEKKNFGFFVSFDFDGNEIEVQQFSEKIKSQKGILRALLIQKPEIKDLPRPKIIKRAVPGPITGKTEAPKEKAVPISPEEKEKQMKEIDKKLDEILKE